MNKRYISELKAELSPLGFGLMRLPMNEENWFSNDVFDLIDKSIELGINYYDTGYYYLNERSEELIREALVKRYSKEQFYIADKLPVWDCRSREDMDRIFNIQLERLGVESIDFYLLHALHRQRWHDMYEAGVLDFLEEKKRSGQIKRVGFSFHDSGKNMKEVVNAYSWDFAQIQLNYYDWTAIHTEDNYRLLEKEGIPCITMESVGGGRLSVLPRDAREIFEGVHSDWSPSAWAMRFVSSLPDVAVVLSGMNSENQLLDNWNNCKDHSVLTDSEIDAIQRAVTIIQSREAIPCTACRYCISECPKKIDIPQVFKAYNDWRIFEDERYFDIAYNLLAGSCRAEDCIGCGRCKQKCPQGIEIPGKMRIIAAKAFERETGIKEMEAERVICFGCGMMGRKVIKYLQYLNTEIVCLCDNDRNLWDTEQYGYPVIPPDRIAKTIKEERASIIVASARYHEDIVRQLYDLGIDRGSILNA